MWYESMIIWIFVIPLIAFASVLAVASVLHWSFDYLTAIVFKRPL